MTTESVSDQLSTDNRRPIDLRSPADFEKVIEQHDLVLVEFVTPSCGICASMEPVLGNVAKSVPWVIGIVDGTEVPELSTRYNVRRVPTFLVFRDGDLVDRIDDGFIPTEELIEQLNEHTPESKTNGSGE